MIPEATSFNSVASIIPIKTEGRSHQSWNDTTDEANNEKKTAEYDEQNHKSLTPFFQLGLERVL